MKHINPTAVYKQAATQLGPAETNTGLPIAALAQAPQLQEANRAQPCKLY